MSKFKGIVSGIMALGMVSAISTGVFADEFEGFDDFFNDDFFHNDICIGESNENSNLAEKIQECKELKKYIKELEEELEEIKKGLAETPEYSIENDEFIDLFAMVSENIQGAEEELQILEEEIRNAMKNHGFPEIGDSDDIVIGDSHITIGDSHDITIGNSGKHHKHRHYHEFKEDSWEGFVSCDFMFKNNHKFKDKKNPELKASALALLDTYSDTDSYIADGTEDWWLKNKHQLTIKITGEEEYEIKFNPIVTDGEVTSCYMYILADDDVITEGYFITAEEYASLKTSLNDTFLKDNVVAFKHDIHDFDKFIGFIEDSYPDQTDYFYDVNGDTSVDGRDLITSKKYNLGLTEELGNYDSNNDDSCDGRDIIQLKKRMLGLI